MAKKVLLIDHHPNLRELLTTLLLTEGYEVRTCRCTPGIGAIGPGADGCDAILVNVATPEGNWKFDYGGWHCLQAYLPTGTPVVAYTLATEYEIGEIKDRLALLDCSLICHPIDLRRVSAELRRAMTPVRQPAGRLALVG